MLEDLPSNESWRLPRRPATASNDLLLALLRAAENWRGRLRA